MSQRSAHQVTVMLVREPTTIPRKAIIGPASVREVCEDMAARDREVFRVLHLDNRSRLIGYEDVSVGTLNASLVHPREVFKGAILANAASIVVAHNHTSGILDPSEEDKEVTRRLVEAGRLLGIPLLDHVVVGPTGARSMSECCDGVFGKANGT